MKCEKSECGIKLIAETPFEQECLKHLASEQLHTEWEDTWNCRGYLELKFMSHPWDSHQ